MERLITAKEIVENYTNRETLTYYFISGGIKAYHKNTLEPFDGKLIYNFFQEFRETFKKENLYFLNDKHPVHMDPRTGVYYGMTMDKQEVEIDTFSWIDFYLELRKIPEWAKEDEEFYQYFTKGYPLYGKFCEEIENGWGLLQAEQIVFESLFKEREVIDIFCTQQQQVNHEITALEELELLSLEKLWPEATRQRIEGFEVFKKRLEKHFQTGIRAAIAVIDYCHTTNAKLRFEDLENLFDEKVPLPDDAKSLEEYRGKISTELARDIYKELGEKYRHKRGEKKPSNRAQA